MKDQLRKGYIRLSKLLQTSLVFFVLKKDGKKRMVQDYKYLNGWMIKNNYPLPLISDLIDSIGKKKVVVATTRPMSNSSTNNKSHRRDI